MRLEYRGKPCEITGVGFAKVAQAFTPARLPNALHLVCEDEPVTVKAGPDGVFASVTRDGVPITVAELPVHSEDLSSWVQLANRRVA